MRYGKADLWGARVRRRTVESNASGAPQASGPPNLEALGGLFDPGGNWAARNYFQFARTGMPPKKQLFRTTASPAYQRSAHPYAETNTAAGRLKSAKVPT